MMAQNEDHSNSLCLNKGMLLTVLFNLWIRSIKNAPFYNQIGINEGEKIVSAINTAKS